MHLSIKLLDITWLRNQPHRLRNCRICYSLVLLLTGLLLSVQATGSELGSIFGESGPSRRDLDNDQFTNYLNQYRNQDLRMIDIDAYKVKRNIRYAQQWRRNDGRNWAVEYDISSARYSERFAVHRGNNMRATDIEGYLDGRKLKFAGLWVENRENLGWALWRNMTGRVFREKNTEQIQLGRSLVDVEAYQTRSGLRFAAIWYENRDNSQTFFRRGISRSQYQAFVDQQTSAGMKLVDYERYTNDSGETRYMALFKSGIAGRVIVRTNRNAQDYANDFRKYSDQGYRPVDFERENSAYGAIWNQVSPDRVNFPLARQMRSMLTNYLSDRPNPFLGVSSNPPPGISAAIVLDGRVVFQGGAGFADIANEKAAHGNTIYKLGSIAKVVGATIFARLEERGRLQNDRVITLRRADSVRSQIVGLPIHHNYTAGDLLNHSACVVNYNGLSNIPSGHYDSMLEVLPEIWDAPLLPNSACTPGVTSVYSNPGYVLLGGLIESATGEAMKNLIRSEIALPFNLPSLRAEYAEPNRLASYERSKLYQNSQSRQSDDTSWKVIVGGLEATPIDLARFGWLVGSGQIVSNTTLQNGIRSADFAYGWRIRTNNNRSTIDHGGSSTGALTQLTVWPDQQLAIAVMSNDNTSHTNTELRNFVFQMGQTVLLQYGR